MWQATGLTSATALVSAHAISFDITEPANAQGRIVGHNEREGPRLPGGARVSRAGGETRA